MKLSSQSPIPKPEDFEKALAMSIAKMSEKTMFTNGMNSRISHHSGRPATCSRGRDCKWG